jgi:trans-2,3-dihydro-3-hydroxyanthranilate isomerase
MPHRFHIVDVFAEQLRAGNTLAVVRDAGDLDAAAMQRIAREFGFSETTFVLSATPGEETPVRIFTPAEELPFAGHPTLGTAWVIREHRLRERPAAVTLALGVGPVPVAFEPEPGGDAVAWLTAPPGTLGRTLAPARLAPALGLSPRDFSRDLPVQHVSAGVAFVHVPLASADAVRRARFELAACEPLAREGLPASSRPAWGSTSTRACSSSRAACASRCASSRASRGAGPRCSGWR